MLITLSRPNLGLALMKELNLGLNQPNAIAIDEFNQVANERYSNYGNLRKRQYLLMQDVLTNLSYLSNPIQGHAPPPLKVNLLMKERG